MTTEKDLRSDTDKLADRIAADAMRRGYFDSNGETAACPPCIGGAHGDCMDQRPHGWLICWCNHRIAVPAASVCPTSPEAGPQTLPQKPSEKKP